MATTLQTACLDQQSLRNWNISHGLFFFGWGWVLDRRTVSFFKLGLTGGDKKNAQNIYL